MSTQTQKEKQHWDSMVARSRILEAAIDDPAGQFPQAKRFILNEMKQLLVEMENA